jgi:hypothetical protein
MARTRRELIAVAFRWLGRTLARLLVLFWGRSSWSTSPNGSSDRKVPRRCGSGSGKVSIW